MSTDEKKRKRLSFRGHSHSAGDASSLSDAVNGAAHSTGSLGNLTRAVLHRSKSNQGSSLESLAIELSDQPQPNFSSSGGEQSAKDKPRRDKADKKKDKEKKKLKKRQSSEESVQSTTAAACSTAYNNNTSNSPTRTPSPSSSSPALMIQSLQTQLHVLQSSAGAADDSSLYPPSRHSHTDDESTGRPRPASYSEPHDVGRPRTLSQGQRASLDQQGLFAKELRQISNAMRQNAEQIAILRSEVEAMHQLEMARQRMEMQQQSSVIKERIREIDDETACCGLRCCGGLWDCLF